MVSGTFFFQTTAALQKEIGRGDRSMTLYVARHGETDWNKSNRVLGRTDAPLNETGLAQARELVRALHGISLRAVYTSPLRRAAEIGRMVAEDHGLISQTDERLIEMDFGLLEGAQRDDPAYLAEKRKLFARYPGGESYFEAAARVYSFLDELKRAGGDGTVLVVTHNGICRVAATYFMDMTEEEFMSYSMKNCEVRSFLL